MKAERWKEAKGLLETDEQLQQLVRNMKLHPSDFSAWSKLFDTAKRHGKVVQVVIGGAHNVVTSYKLSGVIHNVDKELYSGIGGDPESLFATWKRRLTLIAQSSGFPWYFALEWLDNGTYTLREVSVVDA